VSPGIGDGSLYAAGLHLVTAAVIVTGFAATIPRRVETKSWNRAWT
jgi:hypothetical protein